ncbi:MAG: S41 family peptidase [Anaerolineales bacterium]|nr:S41 family peptidase [Anaerolineales bacterium]
MNSKPLIIVASVALALILLTGACSAGFIAGQAFRSASSAVSLFKPPVVAGSPGSEQPTDTGAQTMTPEELDELFEPFWQTWELVKEDFVAQPVDEELMMRGAIQGMLESLGDEHTSYLDPEMFESATAHLDGQEYEGIGAWVDTTQDYLTIISPMPGSPAQEAGLRPNDKIIAIDGEDMTGIDGELVRQRVLGPKGTTIRLTILREGSEPFDVDVTRAAIVVPTVDSRMLEGDVAYVQLFTFGDDTAADLRSALEELLEQEPAGLILDLRNNGGGYLETAIDVVSEFIGDGVVMYEEYGDGRREIYEARGNGLATEIPLVVLINEGSASASEIVAGAIQDSGRGRLVGVTSFGKGSVQTYVPLKNDQGAVRVTVARWLTPNGRQIHEIGLEPDYVVEISEQEYAEGLDPQLDKAIELLTQQ